jgi:hypothetical protein
MNDNNRPLDPPKLAEAAAHLRAAIALLDQSGASGHIAAHADLALNEVDRLIATPPGSRSCSEQTPS